MNLSRSLVVAVIFATAASFSRADFYVKAAGLYNKPGDVHINNPSAFGASLKSNVGLAGAVGYKFSLLRIEAELQHLRSVTNPDPVSGTLFGGTIATTGAIKETAGFANAYFDFPAFFGLAPYVGAGLGYARVELDGFGRTRNNVPVAQFSGRDSVYGYQGMLGLQYHLFGAVTLNAGYRFLKRQDIAVRDVIANAQQSLNLGSNRVFELGVAIGF